MENMNVKLSLKEIFGDFWKMISNRFCVSDTTLSLLYGEDKLDCKVVKTGSQIDYVVFNKQGCPIYNIHKKLSENGVCKEVYYQEIGKNDVIVQAKLWRDDKGCYEQSLRKDSYDDGNQFVEELCHIQYGNHNLEKRFIKVNITNVSAPQNKLLIKIKAVSHPDYNPLRAFSDEASVEIDKGRVNFNLKFDTMEEIIDKFNRYYSNSNILRTRKVRTVSGDKVEFDETYLPPMSFNQIPYFTSFDKTKVSEHLNISTMNSNQYNIDDEAEENGI